MYVQTIYSNIDRKDKTIDNLVDKKTVQQSLNWEIKPHAATVEDRNSNDLVPDNRWQTSKLTLDKGERSQKLAHTICLKISEADIFST